MSTNPDLTHRVERLEEDLRAIADTLLDVKEIVDGHTADLAEIKATQAAQGRQLDEILQLLRTR